MKKSLVVLMVVLAATLLVSGLAMAKVTGQCAECHTMHNSQNGIAVARTGTDVGWTGGSIGGGTITNTPHGNLLVSTCIGCHTSADANTIIVNPTTGNTIPIVRNLSAPTEADLLAGGNFYYVEADGDAYGHNIITKDVTLLEAPGLDGTNDGTWSSHSYCSDSCHTNLVTGPAREDVETGCQGCHFMTFHHKDPGTVTDWTDPIAATAVDPTYRFLAGHHYLSGAHSNGNRFVEGIEDANWESGSYKTTGTAGSFNVYRGYNGTKGVVNEVNHSISSFCAACHTIFHEEQSEGSTWVRHPADQLLPTYGEYSAYDYINNYSTEAPVAFVDNTVGAGNGMVMCLSCHRPHGSPNPDMLRWDYTTQIASGGGSDTGCFTCHTSKNNP